MSKTLHYRAPANTGVRTFIAVPAYSGVSPGFSFSLFQSAAENTDLSMELHFLTEYCHVDDARNTIVNSFLQSDCDQLIFIDADTYWEPSNLRRLILSDKDVIAGVIPKKSDSTEFNVRIKKGATVEGGVLEVEGIGTAFMKIRRNVLEDLAKESESFIAPNYKTPIKIIFERGLFHGRRLGGDINFCEKAKAKGYKIYVDPNMRFGHYGENYWEGNFMNHLAKEQGFVAFDLMNAVDSMKACDTSDQAFIDLWLAWDNKDWSASPDLLMASYFIAKEHDHVLECGSGITTIVMALSGCKVTALEHDYEWYLKIRDTIDLLGLDAEVIYAPIKEYDGFSWYDTPEISGFDLLFVDGPPRTIGRDGVFEVMNTENCTIIMDDTKEFTREGYDTMCLDGMKPFIISRPVVKKCA